MQFEWDEDKREKTLRERGIDFVDAALIWKDPKRQECADNRHSYGESRMQTIGASRLGLLFVVYTERVYEDGQEFIRIISARKANRREQSDYESMTFRMRLSR